MRVTNEDIAKIIMLPVGRRMAYLRYRRGWTQPVMAQLLGRSKSWIDKVECGARSLDSLKLIYEIADLLEVDPGLLITRSSVQKGYR